MSSRPEPERIPPDANAVAKRALILKHRLQKGLATPPPDHLAQLLQQWSEGDRAAFLEKMKHYYQTQEQRIRNAGLWNDMDEVERAFIQAGPVEIPQQAWIDANWVGESLSCLLWALELFPEIPASDKELSIERKKHLARLPEAILTGGHKLRASDLIEKQRDLAELWHWRSRTRRLQEEGRTPAELPGGMTVEQMLRLTSQKAADEGLIPPPISGDFPALGKAYRDLSPTEFSIATSIAVERHRAFNWLFGYAPGNRWTETPTDT